MGIVQRIKEGVGRLVRRPKKEPERATYSTQYDAEGKVVGVTKTSDRPPEPPKKKFTEKVQESMQKHTEYAKSIVGRSGEVVGSAMSKAASVPKKAIEAGARVTGAPVSSSGVSTREAQKSIKRDVLVGLAPIGGEPYQKALRRMDRGGKKQKVERYGRRVSKKEVRMLEKKYGKDWRKNLQQDKQGYFTISSPQIIAQEQRENRLFGSGLTSADARVPFARRSEDPWDVDAMFSNGVIVSQGRDKFNIDSNFKGKVKL